MLCHGVFPRACREPPSRPPGQVCVETSKVMQELIGRYCDPRYVRIVLGGVPQVCPCPTPHTPHPYPMPYAAPHPYRIPHTHTPCPMLPHTHTAYPTPHASALRCPFTPPIPQATALLALKFGVIFYTGNTTVGKIVCRAAVPLP